METESKLYGFLKDYKTNILYILNKYPEHKFITLNNNFMFYKSLEKIKKVSTDSPIKLIPNISKPLIHDRVYEYIESLNLGPITIYNTVRPVILFLINECEYGENADGSLQATIRTIRNRNAVNLKYGYAIISNLSILVKAITEELFDYQNYLKFHRSDNLEEFRRRFYNTFTEEQVNTIFSFREGIKTKNEKDKIKNKKNVNYLTISDNKFIRMSVDSDSFNKTIKSTKYHTCTSEGIIQLVQNSCLVKIKSFEESANIFGYGKLKKLMYQSNETYRISEILPNHECKKDSILRDVIEIQYEGRSYKFLYSDIEIITPLDIINKILKSYNFPKDRTLRIGSQVKVINNKKLKVPLNFKGSVKDIRKIGTEKFAVLAENNNNYIINVKKLKVI